MQGFEGFLFDTSVNKVSSEDHTHKHEIKNTLNSRPTTKKNKP